MPNETPVLIVVCESTGKTTYYYQSDIDRRKRWLEEYGK